MSEKFRLRQRVRLRAAPDDVGVVLNINAHGGEPSYEVFFDAFRQQVYPEHALLAVDADDEPRTPVDYLRTWRLGSAEDFDSYLTYERLTHKLAGTVYSYMASRTELLPYQFRPVLKLLDNPYSRLLIADEVGLGKTIEAGIILTELHARSPLTRVIVVCPSGLTDKWRSELRERFELEFEVLRGAAVRDALQEAARNPGRPQRLIASLETLRQDSARELLEELRLDFDLVIVDEAHHMRNSWTKANELGHHLSSVSDTMVFLTATPLNLGREDFFELLHLLVPEEFDDYESFETQIAPNAHLNAAVQALRSSPIDLRSAAAELAAVGGLVSRRVAQDPRFLDAQRSLESAAGDGGDLPLERVVAIQRTLTELNTLAHVFTRTKKREVQELFPLRRADPVPVEFTDAEREFYDAITAWVRLANERYGVGVGAFVLINYQRQLASCLPAAGARLERTILSGVLSLAAGETDDYDIEDLASDEAIAAAMDDGIEIAVEASRDRSLETRIAHAWRDVQGVDSKFEAFAEKAAELIEAGVDKILVFSFFVGTIDYLEKRLQGEGAGGVALEVFKLYGRTPPEKRGDVVAAFEESKEPAVLLSSEVGSEGLDFQFCSAMFNYDLPWNPMRVEQRIGRLDRYGQRSDYVQILNLVVPDTIEGRIFYRLYDRINIFKEAIGDLEAILSDSDLEGDLARLKRDVVFGALTASEEERRSEIIARAIEQKRIDLDEFDRESKRFVGHDEVFRERFHDIQEGRRYISPGQLQGFVEGYIRRQHPGVRLRPVAGRDGLFVLSGTGRDDVYDRLLRPYLLSSVESSRLDWTIASRLVGADARPLTFDAEVAVADRRVEFISIHHPLVRAISHAMSEAHDLLPTGSVSAPAPSGVTTGPRIFFVYRADIKGIKPELDLVPVAVDTNGEVDEELTPLLAPLLASGQPSSCMLEGWLREDLVDAAEGAAWTWIHRWRDAREAEMKQYASAVVEAQLESVQLGFERRMRRVEQRQQTAVDERMIRMLRGQRRNAERRYEQKRGAIGRKREVAIGLDLMAAGVIDLIA